jgi:hypothetical protein
MNEDVSGTPENDDMINKRLAKMVRHSRRYIWIILTVLSVLALVLTGAVSYLLFSQQDQINQNHELAIQFKNGAIANCESGNTARVTNKQLWDEFFGALVNNPNGAKMRSELEGKIALLNLSPSMRQGLDDIIIANWTPDPGNIRLVQALEAYVAAKEKPQDCTKIYGGN